MRQLLPTARALRAGGLALAISACGEPSSNIEAEPDCQAWLERFDACVAAAPAGMRVALEPAAALVRREGRRVPAGAFVAESCASARARVAERAAALCPEVRWESD